MKRKRKRKKWNPLSTFKLSWKRSKSSPWREPESGRMRNNERMEVEKEKERRKKYKWN